MIDRIKDAERLRRLQRLTDEALAHLELEELLAALLLRVKEILDVDTCAILLLDEERNELVARAAVGIEEEVEQGVRIPVGGGFAGRVAAERRPVVLHEVDQVHVLNPILLAKGIQTLLGVPLVVGAKTIGVLHVGSLTPRTFTEEDVELLQLAGDRAAIAIEHARLFAAERAARTRLEQVQAVTDAALAHLELERLLDVLLSRLREVLGADTAAILLLDEERDELVARAALGIEEEVEQGVRIPVGGGFAGRVAAERRPVILDDVDHAHVLNPILREKGIKSLLGVPLIVDGRVLGVLHVGQLTHRKFSEADAELLQLVAERVALAIERARLHQEIVLLDQLKLHFVATASHELRTPATSVYGAVATIVERGDTLAPEVREQLLRSAYEQGARLRRLVEQLLDLSRLDARAFAVDPRRVELAPMLSQIVREAVPPGVSVSVDVEPEVAVVADPVVLDRVVSNLVLNAVRYGRPPISVTARVGDDAVAIAVEDSGGGVADAVRHRLFERFERGDHGGGSGLGLAIARAYARAHGGDLVYVADRPGARFELTVPQPA